MQTVHPLRHLPNAKKITVAPFAASLPRRTLLSSSLWVNKVPEDIWVYKILLPFLDLKALATAGRCNTFFQEFWQYVLKQNVIRVPEGCPTMNQAMELAVIFSERNDCKRVNPVKVEVMTTMDRVEIKTMAVPSRTSTPTVHSHTYISHRSTLLGVLTFDVPFSLSASLSASLLESPT